MTQKVVFDYSVPQVDKPFSKIKDDLEVSVKTKIDAFKQMQNKVLSYSIASCTDVDKKWIKDNAANLIEFSINNETSRDIEESDTEVFVNFYKTLVDRNKQDQQLLLFLKEEISREEKKAEELKKCFEYMSLTYLEDKEQEEYTESLELKSMNDKVSKMFQELKKDFHYVLGVLFKEEEIALIQKLTEAYFKEGDQKYITINDEHDADTITCLLKMSLIMRDPYDTKRIKMEDIA